MSTSWFKWPTWGAKTAEQLEEEKAAEIEKITQKYDELIAKAEAASPPAEGTADLDAPATTEEATGGRRRKTKRAKKSKSKRSRTGRKSTRS